MVGHYSSGVTHPLCSKYAMTGLSLRPRLVNRLDHSVWLGPCIILSVLLLVYDYSVYGVA
jgi:hypothetical protein